MLRCNICAPGVAASALPPGAQHVVPLALTDTIRWCVPSDLFVGTCHYVGAGSFSTDASLGWTVDRSDLSANSQRVHMTEVSANLSIPTIDPPSPSSGALGKVGNVAVSYDRLLYGNDASGQPTALLGEASATTTTWSFVDTSLSLVVRWSADGSRSYIDTAIDPGATIRFQKPRNDAACDHIQTTIGGADAMMDIAELGLTNASADTVLAELDFASEFASQTQSRAECALQTDPLVQIADATFTGAVLELVQHHDPSRSIVDTPSLRAAVADLIQNGHLCGLQSETPFAFRVSTELAGVDYTSQTPLIQLTPALLFHDD